MSIDFEEPARPLPTTVNDMECGGGIILSPGRLCFRNRLGVVTKRT